jgi:hypothetical protein
VTARDFLDIERRLYTVLDALADVLLPAERQLVIHFIEVREYGLALETLCAILMEEKKRFSEGVFVQLVELAETMGIHSTTTAPLRERGKQIE